MNLVVRRSFGRRWRGKALRRGAAACLGVAVLAGCADKPTQPGKTAVGLQISAAALSIYAGGTLQLSAIASFADGTSSDVTAEAAWSNLPARAGSVDKTGLFAADSDSTGIETVRADYHGNTATAQIAVTKRAISLTIYPVTATVQSGGTVQFEAVAQFHDATQAFVSAEVSWSLLLGVVATIDSNGLFRAKPGLTGQETVICGYQALTVQSRVRVQADATAPFETVAIPAGSFTMGDDSGSYDEKPAHQVYVDAFEIGKYEVTNAQYVTFLNEALAVGEIFYEMFIVKALRGPFAPMTYTKFCPSFQFPDVFIRYVEVEPGAFEFRAEPGFEQYPVVRLNWYGAAAFCAFYGLRLPTEAEWEKASRGGLQLEYGTQDGTSSHDLANHAGTGGRDIYEGLAPVGSFPPNPFGLYDMSGNAAEFVFDLYDANYYANSPAQNPIGPGPAQPLGRLPYEHFCALTTHRGGSWVHQARGCRSAVRGAICDLAEHCILGDAIAGFRVARSLP